MCRGIYEKTWSASTGSNYRELGGNGATKGWNEPISGTHAFNPGTGNDAFFTDDGFKFHTGMNLNDGQRIDLDDNKNIL